MYCLLYHLTCKENVIISLIFLNCVYNSNDFASDNIYYILDDSSLIQLSSALYPINSNLLIALGTSFYLHPYDCVLHFYSAYA